MIKSSVSAIVYLYCDTVKQAQTMLRWRSMPDRWPWLTVNDWVAQHKVVAGFDA
ncbi:hypothetical protein [Rhodocyclus purpureus]|uniref:hypothetical protein n=1 Tax=Rhodocyclus purpureus TaxID=1067 RepID=UPI001911AB5F|nr:hypothetical protein [Rhodocyclus purpureus]